MLPEGLPDNLPEWGWHTFKLTVRDSSVQVHIVPLGDYRPHTYDDTCWCCPTEDKVTPDIWAHHALDGREWYEKRPHQ
jgi:hypothetical protein